MKAEQAKREAHSQGKTRPSARRRATALLFGIAAAAGVGAAGIGPAGADPGVVFEDPLVYEDVHPCTGAPRIVDSVYTVRVHEHRNLELIQVEMYSIASDGTIERGTQIVRIKGDILKGNFNTNNVDDNGNRFTGHARFTANFATGEITEERMYTCKGSGRVRP